MADVQTEATKLLEQARALQKAHSLEMGLAVKLVTTAAVSTELQAVSDRLDSLRDSGGCLQCHP